MSIEADFSSPAGHVKSSRWHAQRMALVRFLVAAAFLGILAVRFENAIVGALLPAFRAEIEWLDDTYRIDRLFLDHQGADQVVRIEVRLAHYIVLNGQAYRPDPRGKANASTLAGNVTLPAVLLLTLVLAWPLRRDGRKLAEATARAVLAGAATVLIWAVDVPMILWGGIWSLHVDAFAPGMFSPLLVWNDFLQGGGRVALAIVLGGISCGAASRLARKRSNLSTS